MPADVVRVTGAYTAEEESVIRAWMNTGRKSRGSMADLAAKLRRGNWSVRDKIKKIEAMEEGGAKRRLAGIEPAEVEKPVGFWTGERIRSVRQLAAGGASDREIAAEIDAPSAMAVTRLRLAEGIPSGIGTGQVTRKSRLYCPRAVVDLSVDDPQPVPALTDFEPLFERPDGLPTLFSIGRFQCRWPLWSADAPTPTVSDALVCGEPATRGPYCRCHFTIANGRPSVSPAGGVAMS